MYALAHLFGVLGIHSLLGCNLVRPWGFWFSISSNTASLSTPRLFSLVHLTLLTTISLLHSPSWFVVIAAKDFFLLIFSWSIFPERLKSLFLVRLVLWVVLSFIGFLRVLIVIIIPNHSWTSLHSINPTPANYGKPQDPLSISSGFNSHWPCYPASLWSSTF